MALRDDEKRQLAEIEHRLAEDDPRFAAKLSVDPKTAGALRKAMLVALVLATWVVGLTIIVLGVALSLPILVVVGAPVVAAVPVRIGWLAWRERHFD
jgi:hypothetical protein